MFTKWTSKNNQPKIYGLFPHCWMHTNTWIVHTHWRWGSNSVILIIPSLKVSCHFFFFKGFGSPAGSQYLIWEVSTVGTSELQYFDLLQTDLAVSAPCNVSRPREPNPSNASESATSANAYDGPEASEGSEDFTEVPRSETTEWPGCIEAGISRQAVDTKITWFYMFESVISRCIIHMYPHLTRSKIGKSGWKLTHSRCILGRSLEGRGLFVNLGALGIERGCFQDDCSHSDHFEAVTPAECAKICKKSLGWSDKTWGEKHLSHQSAKVPSATLVDFFLGEVGSIAQYHCICVFKRLKERCCWSSRFDVFPWIRSVWDRFVCKHRLQRSLVHCFEQKEREGRKGQQKKEDKGQREQAAIPGFAPHPDLAQSLTQKKKKGKNEKKKRT